MTEQRTLADGREWLLTRLENGGHPLGGLEPDDARATIERLEGLDPQPWTDAWGALADTYVAQAESATTDQERHDAWLRAYRAAFMGRYPVPNHPLKQRMYHRTREYFLNATTREDPPIEPVSIPFEGREGDGDEIRFYMTYPGTPEPAPVALVWAGIDTWKEEMHFRAAKALRARGFAVLLLDMPGVGECPVKASTDAERLWTPIFDWLDRQDRLDPVRRAVIGASFGGYWAMKLAYTHADRLAAAVNWGGGVHLTFTPEWQHKSRDAASYLMDLMAARAGVFGGSTFEDYVARCQELSLLDQGWLDKPSAPILLVNGRDDVQNTIDDIYLSLDHGDAKSARVFDGGHMGHGPVVATVVNWVADRLDLPSTPGQEP